MANLNDNMQSTNQGLQEVTKNAEAASKALDKVADSEKKVNDEASNGAKKVGEYETSFEKMGATANTALGVIAASVSQTNPALSSMIGSVQKLIPNLTELGNAAKKSGSLLKAMTSGAGILTLITLVTTLITNFDNITESLGFSKEAVDKFKKTATKAFTDVIKVIGGVGNAIANYFVSPIKGLIGAIKKAVKGDFKGALEEVKNGIKEQFSFGKAFNAGSEWVENAAEGIKSRRAKKAATEAAKEVAKETVDEFQKVLNEAIDGISDDIEKAIEKLGDDLPELTNLVVNDDTDALKRYGDFLKGRMTEEQKAMSELNLQKDQLLKDGLLSQLEIEQWYAEESERIQKESNEKKIASMSTYADAAAGLMSGLADMLESDEKNSEKNAKKVKALRIASATIDMFNGAIKAYMAAQDLPGGPIIGAINAASAIAMGVANINKIRAVDETGASGGSSVSANVSYATASPSVSSSLPMNYQVAMNTSSDYTEAINGVGNKIGSQRTVLVVDDLNKVQANMDTVKAKSSF